MWYLDDTGLLACSQGDLQIILGIINEDCKDLNRLEYSENQSANNQQKNKILNNLFT